MDNVRAGLRADPHRPAFREVIKEIQLAMKPYIILLTCILLPICQSIKSREKRVLQKDGDYIIIVILPSMYNHVGEMNLNSLVWLEMVKFLIDKGADLQTEDKKGMSPTMFAKKSNKNELVSLLLENGGAPIKEGKSNANNRRPKAPAAQQAA